MTTSALPLVLLGVTAFSLATTLEPWFQSWAGSRTGSGSLIQVALGDGRKLFARHLYLKADAYFHNGYYPTIYDSKEGFEKAHVSEDRHQDGEHGEETEDFLGQPKDWLDRFSRHFFPARHTHLGDSGCGHSCCQRAKENHEEHHNCEHEHDHDSDEKSAAGLEREVLPWLRFSTALDPEQPEMYVVGAFHLRRSLNKPKEAEQFLREGLQANPGHPEILFALGRIQNEVHQDIGRARNLWELALRNWKKAEAAKTEPDVLLHAQLLSNLAKLEETQRNYARALEYLAELKGFSPHPEVLQGWIDDLKKQVASPPTP